MKLLLFGASGSGTTTLGIEIEKKAGFKHLDADDYYWVKTNPPFQEKVPLLTRNENLKTDFKKFKNVVVSGSMVSWGNEWQRVFDLAIFIELNNTMRMERLKKREIERYGKKLFTDKRIKENSIAFLEWANKYEDPDFNGRSLKIHNDWIKLLNCKVLLIDSAASLNSNVDIILSEIKRLNNKE